MFPSSFPSEFSIPQSPFGYSGSCPSTCAGLAPDSSLPVEEKGINATWLWLKKDAVTRVSCGKCTSRDLWLLSPAERTMAGRGVDLLGGSVAGGWVAEEPW